VKPAETDPTVKAEALRIADAEGPAEASRRTGVPASTIRMWRTRAKQSAPLSAGVLPVDADIARMRNTAAAARDAADEAIAQIRKTMRLAKSPQSLAIAVGVLMDKAILLDSIVQGIEDREVRLNAAAGQQLAALLELYHAALGIPVTPAARSALRELLTQAGRGGALSVSPATAELARADVRAAILAERGLPAPVNDDDKEPDAVDIVVTQPEPGPVPDDVEVLDEVVDAEVVPDAVPRHYLEAYRGDEQFARSAWEQQKRNEADRVRREAQPPPAFTSYRPSVHRGFGDIFQSTMRNPPGAG
jgi:hypothetical protein